ncbi:MAG TPA: biotin--[acetyl-CoA-carboxylase] ligase [Vicinamibacterales bacterium]|nr:biotin--[acetyl-CoA-carboxylase] ligase [Vicinamibacterales bacterium]
MSDGEPLPDDLAAALLASAGHRGPVGATLHFLSETTSTNDVAARLADRGAPHGTTIVALAQTAGRGRFGRTWFSPPGAGLYVSVICRERMAAPLLTLAAGVALAEGIRRATALPVEIKWPNDIVVTAGAVAPRRRKLAGILAEASTTAGGLQYVVLGFGINLRAAAYPVSIADRATSIETELGRVPDAGAVLAETLAALNARVAQLARGQRDEVLTRWRGLAPSAHGSMVRWETADGVASGVTNGIDDTGALLVRCRTGLHRIVAGEVEWEMA